MLYLILAIVCSALIAIIMRLSARTVTANISMLAANYITCLLLAAGYAGFQIFPLHAPGFSSAVGMGAVNGVLYLLGFVLAVGAVILINYRKGTSFSGFKLTLVLNLLASGCGDAMSKIFEVYGPESYANQFLFYTFASALLLCIVLILSKKERPDMHALLFGVLVGIPNFFSAKFLLMALERLPAVIVYPTFSVATILMVTLAGIGLFKERLRKNQWIALAIILAALILLNI